MAILLHANAATATIAAPTQINRGLNFGKDFLRTITMIMARLRSEPAAKLRSAGEVSSILESSMTEFSVRKTNSHRNNAP